MVLGHPEEPAPSVMSLLGPSPQELFWSCPWSHPTRQVRPDPGLSPGSALLPATHWLRASASPPLWSPRTGGGCEPLKPRDPRAPPLSLWSPGHRQPSRTLSPHVQKLGQFGENPGVGAAVPSTLDTWGADHPHSRDMANKSPTDKSNSRRFYPFHAILVKLSGVPPAGRTWG